MGLFKDGSSSIAAPAVTEDAPATPTVLGSPVGNKPAKKSTQSLLTTGAITQATSDSRFGSSKTLLGQ